jgi:DNA-cytosine methyltransferase
MKILSLFDGISCARVALERAGIPVEAYYASEIDKYAISISQKNYPDIVQCGSVTELSYKMSSGDNLFDLLIGGSPCQDLSIAKKDRKGLDGERSGLFYEYVRILKEVKPKYFILENVASMPKEAKAIITEALGVEPIMINAALVSAQNRKRLFWVGALCPDGTYKQVEISQPEDRGILLRDILEPKVDESFYVKNIELVKGGIGKTNDLIFIGGIRNKDWAKDGKNYSRNFGQGDRVYSPEGKSATLSALGGGRGAKTGLYSISKPVILGDEPLQVLKEGRTELGKQSRKEIREKTGRDSTSRASGYKAYYGREGIKANCITTGLGAEGMVVENSVIRKLTPIECERLQGLPDNYTDGVSNTQRYKALGNAFNVDVVAHIIKHFN